MESSKDFEAGMESVDDEELEDDEARRHFEDRARIQSVSADGPSGAIKPAAPLSVSDSIRGAMSASLMASRQNSELQSADSAKVSVAGKTEPQKADPSQIPATTEPQKPEQQQQQQQQQEQKPAEVAKDAPKPEQTPAAAPSLPKALRRLLAAMQ
jgi:hypothetical protein